MLAHGHAATSSTTSKATARKTSTMAYSDFLFGDLTSSRVVASPSSLVASQKTRGGGPTSFIYFEPTDEVRISAGIPVLVHTKMRRR